MIQSRTCSIQNKGIAQYLGTYLPSYAQLKNCKSIVQNELFLTINYEIM